MKLAVVGSRTFSDYALLRTTLDGYAATRVISGGAAGADTLAHRYATERGIEFVAFLPEWDRYGRSAGFRRNVKIIDEADQVVAFWDGKSKGTGHSIALAIARSVPVVVKMIG